MQDQTKQSQHKRSEKSSSIIRTVHNKKNPYTMLLTELLTDPSIPVEVTGLLAHCLSKPTDWHFHSRQIMKERRISKDKFYRIINLAIKARYVLRIRTVSKSESGKKLFVGYNYIFFEKKYTEEEKDSLIEEFNYLNEECPIDNEEDFKNKIPNTENRCDENENHVLRDKTKETVEKNASTHHFGPFPEFQDPENQDTYLVRSYTHKERVVIKKDTPPPSGGTTIPLHEDKKIVYSSKKHDKILDPLSEKDRQNLEHKFGKKVVADKIRNLEEFLSKRKHTGRWQETKSDVIYKWCLEDEQKKYRTKKSKNLEDDEELKESYYKNKSMKLISFIKDKCPDCKKNISFLDGNKLVIIKCIDYLSKSRCEKEYKLDFDKDTPKILSLLEMVFQHQVNIWNDKNLIKQEELDIIHYFKKVYELNFSDYIKKQNSEGEK